MQVWPVLAALCSASAVAISYPLIRRYESFTQRAAREVAVYDSQIAEVQADQEAGTINVAEASQAKAEIQRRLVAVAKSIENQRPVTEPWRGLALAATAGLVVLGSVNLYAYLGRPDLSDLPSTSPLQAPGVAQVANVPAGTAMAPTAAPAQVDGLVQQLAERLKTSPNDAEGWRMLGWSYFNLQNYAQSAAAYKKALDLVPASNDYKSSYAEALVQASEGMVTPEAQKLIADVLASDPKEYRARFYDALAREQAGAQQEALDRWLALLADAPADAGWREDVKGRITELGKATGRDVSAALALPNPSATAQTSALAQPEKDAMMDGMIAKLAQKLATNPKDRDGWAMMIRSLKVRGDAAGADKALADASAIFKDDLETLQGLQSVAKGEVSASSSATVAVQGSAAPDLNTVDPGTKAAIQAMAPADQQQMIKGMVAKLAARLEAAPGDSDGWVRLMRSYMVLNDAASAKAAKDKALQAFSADLDKRQAIEAAAAELGIH